MALTDAATFGDPAPVLEDGERHTVFALSAGGEAVREARHLVLEHLETWGTAPEERDTAALVISELFTNAVVHTASDVITCSLGASRDWLLITVADDGSGQSTPRPQSVGLHDEGGRGLMIVKAVAKRWGVSRTGNGDGRVVWALLHSTQV
ncbi:ATP-binding protein [Streptomyces sp. NPDC005538]|uniref:ATP-binding protein n=1 Tax=unclassified Streptomyces TaxID=2593676 RepID=UPI0033B9E0CC